MKLRNKKTGGIDDFKIEASGLEWLGYTSLKEFCEDWEDYEEPKEFFAVSPYKIEGYEVFPYDNFGHIYKLAEELGIAFKTKEEAEKAVEKLKAWKRLKDKITCIDRASFDSVGTATLFIRYKGKDHEEVMKDLDLLFGGEE